MATFNEIAVGVDFGPGGDDALALARSLMAEGGRLTLMNVVRSDPHVFGGLSPVAVAQERARSLDLLDRERKLLELSDRQAGHRTSVRPGIRSIYAASVGRGLSFTAAKEKTDLLVVGTTRQGRLGRMLLGDDTAAVLRGAPCSVAVAPAGPVRGRRLTTIGVVYDGSPEGRYAVEVARALAAERAATWAVIAALPAVCNAVGPPVAASDARSVQARHELLALDAPQTHEARDHHPEELAAFSGHVDLLVVGAQWLARPRHPAYRVGSAARLTRLTRCPLLVLVAGDRL